MSMDEQSCPKVANFLPECWNDDERMSCLMSMFKNRRINPFEFDSKLKFWSSLIYSSCYALKKPSFSYSDLVHRFKRKDRIPAGLNVVINDMLEKGEIISSENFSLGGAGWVSWTFDWTVKKPLTWLLGYSEIDVTTQEFVVPKILNDLCLDVMEIWRELQEKSSPTDFSRSGIIEYKKFVRLISPHGFDEKSIALITEQMRRLSLLSIDTSDKGEKLIKFVEDSTSEQNSPITSKDKNFFKLQKTIEMLETDLQRLEETAAILDSDARAHIRANNKPKAKHCLRQKMAILKQIKSKEAACNNGVSLMNQLAQTKEQRQILDAFKAGVDAFKADMAKHGLSVDKIDETMDDVHDALSEQRDISDAISRAPATSMTSFSDADLEEELADLMKDTEIDSPKSVSFPDVPTAISTSTPITKTVRDEDNLARLRRLLESD